MTRALPFTEQSLRAITAARKAGLYVRGIRPDGTLIVHDESEPVVDPSPIGQLGTSSKWEDIQT
jgi:hypothetical protein